MKLPSLLTLCLSLLAAATSYGIQYNIQLTGSNYDASAQATTFTYEVTSGQQPSISHWNIALPCGPVTLVSASEGLVSWSDRPDPTTGVTGIKFDLGYNDNETRTVSLTLAGEWATGEVTIAVKSGNGYVLGTTQGPICGGGVSPTTYTVNGLAFFDANFDGNFGADETVLAGVTVTLLDAEGGIVGTTTTGADGTYGFGGLVAGDYVAVLGGLTGLVPTTLTEHDFSVGPDAALPATGYGLNFAAISTMSANGFTIGYWKNNIDKTLRGNTKGIQVSAATLNAHIDIIADLGLEPFDGLTLAQASTIFGTNGSAATVQLSKQLLAAEFNYANGAYLDGHEYLTYLFVYFGEYVLKHAATLDRAYVLQVKDWFDAYNNTHGGQVLGPL
jgi:hypothetical protein